MPLIDWGTITTSRVGDVNGPASGISTSSQTNENDLAALGIDQYQTEAGDKPWRKSGIHGQIHGDMWSTSNGYDGNDGGDIVPWASGMEGTPTGSPVAWWFGFIALIVALKFIAEKNGGESEFKNIRIGAANIATITLSAIIGLTLMKWVFGIYKIPGLSQIVEAS